MVTTARKFEPLRSADAQPKDPKEIVPLERPAAVLEVLTGTERSEIACPKDSPAGVAPPGPANAHRFAHRPTRRMSSSASCAILGSGKRGCACIPAPTRGRNDPRSVARRPLPRLRHRTGRGVLRHLKRPAAPECASGTLVQRPRAPATAFSGCGARNPKKPVFDFRAHFCHFAPHGNARFRLETPGQRPGGPKTISYEYEVEAEDTHFGGEPVAEGLARPRRPSKPRRPQ